jgi:hypothetical protein
MLKTTTLAMAGTIDLTAPAAAEDVRQAIEQVNSQVMATFKAPVSRRAAAGITGHAY